MTAASASAAARRPRRRSPGSSGPFVALRVAEEELRVGRLSGPRFGDGVGLLDW